METVNALPEKQVSSFKGWVNTYTQKVTASLEVSKSKNHLLVLDGVRAIACLLVLLHHIIAHVVFPELWPGIWAPSGKLQVLLAAILEFGDSGVILFFLLSSFLLFLPFAKALLFDGQWPSLSRFYIRRFFRIVPGYYAAILLMILFFHPEFLHAAYRVRLFEFFTFSMGAQVPAQLNGPFWTMAVEFQFYMLLPLIAWILSLIVRRGPLRWRVTKLVSCLVIMLGWGLLTRWWGILYYPTNVSVPQNIIAVLQPYYYGDNGKYFECFAVGMLLALLYVYVQNAPKGERLHLKLQRWSSWMWSIGLLITSFLAIYRFFALNGQYDYVFPFVEQHAVRITETYMQWQSLVFSICYGLCICALLYAPGRLKKPFEWPVFRWIGLFSYSLYMWHYPLLLLFVGMLNTQLHNAPHVVQLIAILAWVFFVIFPISLTFYRWIEMPGMRLGEMVLRSIQKPKKKSSSGLTEALSVELALPVPLEPAQVGAYDPEKTEPRLHAASADTPGQ